MKTVLRVMGKSKNQILLALIMVSLGHLQNITKVLHELNPMELNYIFDWAAAIILSLGISVSTVLFTFVGRWYIAIITAGFDMVINIIYYNRYYLEEATFDKFNVRWIVTVIVSCFVGALIFMYSEINKIELQREEKDRLKEERKNQAQIKPKREFVKGERPENK
jgi:cbb3-type cytochrome oxidase subunit 3